MSLVRLLLGAFLALVAMIAALFAAVVVVISGLLTWLTGGKVRGHVSINRRPAASTARGGPASGAKGEVIDVEATRVPEKRIDGGENAVRGGQAAER